MHHQRSRVTGSVSLRTCSPATLRRPLVIHPAKCADLLERFDQRSPQGSRAKVDSGRLKRLRASRVLMLYRSIDPPRTIDWHVRMAQIRPPGEESPGRPPMLAAAEQHANTQGF